MFWYLQSQGREYDHDIIHLKLSTSKIVTSEFQDGCHLNMKFCIYNTKHATNKP